MVPVNHGGQHENMELIKGINFIEKAMNITKRRKTLEKTTGLQSDQVGRVINLSNKRFTKETFKFLNKDSDFALTPNL